MNMYVGRLAVFLSARQFYLVVVFLQTCQVNDGTLFLLCFRVQQDCVIIIQRIFSDPKEFVGFDACIREIFLRPFELRVDLKRHLRIVQFILDDLFYSIFAFLCFTGFICIHQFAQKLGKLVRCLPQNSGRDQGAGLDQIKAVPILLA